ncbi:hypothetical protein [Chitinilyticum litopenaei]|uniref:hypothetical protein n=1 Tax=Chitinilyticum litopenaei TaxID=1121276 RepID=UPI0003F7CDEC|nr:hypothetical protein [Chitinilyticum litopenaei]
MTTEIAEVQEKEQTALVVIESLAIRDVLKDAEKTAQLIDEVRRLATSYVADVTTADGRKTLRSLAVKVARTKTYLDDMGKEYVAELKDLPRLIDGNRKAIRESLDLLKEEVRKPLTEWEAEQERIAAEKKAAEEAAALAERIELDWELADLMNREFDRQRAEAEERAEQERKEREARIAAEAAERAKREAEEKAAREKAEAEQRAAEARLAQERAEREAEEANKRAAEAEQRAAREAEEAARKACEKAEAETAERQRREAAEAQAREQDKQRRATVHNDMLADLQDYANLSEAQAKEVVVALARKQVRHASIAY